MPKLNFPKYVQVAARRARRAVLVAPAVLLAALPSCTDLTETPVDATTPGNTFRSNTEIIAGLTSVYASLRSTMWGYYNLSEVTTDEFIVPTRGSDWFDNGRWLEIHRQSWTGGGSASALDDMNSTWNDLFTGISRANLVITSIQNNGVTGQEGVIAELRTLRAFYYYCLMDMFGGVPIVQDIQVIQRPRNTRAEVFKFIEDELNAVRTVLPVQPVEGGRVTRGVADAILANMYLNAQVFAGTPTASGITLGAARWEDAILAADRVIGSTAYQLEPDIRANFSVTNEDSRENILTVRHVAQNGLGMQLQMRGLHYNSVNPGAWNGWATLADTYNKYNAADPRRNITWATGRQSNLITGELINERNGSPLVFTVDIANPTAATEGEGPRMIKYPPARVAPDGNHPNDFAWFRLAEMYLIKGEAQFRLGQTAAALETINTVRRRSFPSQPLTSLTLQTILDERLFELAAEAKRRQDLIRFGRFTEARRFKPATEPYKVLFPIPQVQLGTNAQLQQNPGYQ